MKCWHGNLINIARKSFKGNVVKRGDLESERSWKAKCVDEVGNAGKEVRGMILGYEMRSAERR